jgi:hypothetical protein
MIKVRVGQVWECASDDIPSRNIGEKVEIETVNGDYVIVESRIFIKINNLISCYKFIPQNDLEKLAVTETQWFHSDCDWVRLDEYDRPMYTSDIDHPLNKNKHYTHRSEWRNMRYYLGLDKKPHYKFINGQWSEMK